MFAGRHPAYLRAGLWPIAPFATPALSRFGRSLSPLVYDMLSLDIGIRSMCAGTASGEETWCAFSTPKR